MPRLGRRRLGRGGREGVDSDVVQAYIALIEEPQCKYSHCSIDPRTSAVGEAWSEVAVNPELDQGAPDTLAQTQIENTLNPDPELPTCDHSWEFRTSFLYGLICKAIPLSTR